MTLPCISTPNVPAVLPSASPVTFYHYNLISKAKLESHLALPHDVPMVSAPPALPLPASGSRPSDAAA